MNRKNIIIAAIAGVLAIGLSGCTVAGNAPSLAEDPPVQKQAAPEPEPTPTPEVGTLENPFPVGYTLTVYQGTEDNELAGVVISLKEANANKAIAQANQFNDPATNGTHYVAVEYAITGLSDEPQSASVLLWDWSLALDDGTLIPEADTVVLPSGWNQTWDVNDLYSGQSASVVVIYEVPDSYAGTLYVTAYGQYVALS